MLRIAGPAADDVLLALGLPTLPRPRVATLAELRDPVTGLAVDRALVLRFPGPASFTGDDLVELQHHGGLGVRSALADILTALPDCRPALPGEFTRRAFMNGKLDLTEVAGLADLIEATSARSARVALARLGGAFARRIDGWSRTILAVRALLEADIDFAADQADVDGRSTGMARGLLDALLAELAEAIHRSPAVERLQDGYVIAIAGAPNVGKSSLINLLVRREVSIVTERPGTTRDAIEVPVELGGLPVFLVDTAGLRNTDDPIEVEGIARARQRAAMADIVLELVDAAHPVPVTPPDERRVVVANKVDLAPPPSGLPAISCHSGAGIEQLVELLVAKLGVDLPAEPGAVPGDARERSALARAASAIRTALGTLAQGEPVLAAEDLRAAQHALAEITGQTIDAEDVLGEIFSRFCIGK